MIITIYCLNEIHNSTNLNFTSLGSG
uniref:Uncharacterized protein n=1 Tax=Rhizophora mucronata TaxID=61149 RepID=A0A2P2PAD1_RHIMU